MRDSRRRKCSFKKHLATICTFLLTHIKQLEFCFVVRVLILQKHLSFLFFWLCIVCWFFWVKMRPDLFADGPHFPWKKVSIFRMNTRFFRQLQTEGYDNKKLTKKYCDLICVFFRIAGFSR